MLDTSRARLLDLIKTRGAVSFGRFVLASGQESNVYVNSKKAMLNSEVLWLLGDIFWEMTKDLNIQAVGGPEVGAIPIAVAAALRYHQEGRALEGFFVRGEAKSHGNKDLVEGVLKPEFRVVVVDDVFTKGTSVLRAVTEVERVGAEIVAVSCIVDREQGARERLSRFKYLPIFRLTDLGIAG